MHKVEIRAAKSRENVYHDKLRVIKQRGLADNFLKLADLFHGLAQKIVILAEFFNRLAEFLV